MRCAFSESFKFILSAKLDTFLREGSESLSINRLQKQNGLHKVSTVFLLSLWDTRILMKTYLCEISFLENILKQKGPQ